MLPKLLHRAFAATILLAFSFSPVWAQSGKIAGTVTDQATGDPLPGVNVVLEGTTQGATTNADGQYTILNVTPGTYTVRASFVGYATQNIEDVRVNIDLTTTLDIQLQEEAVGLEEVTVQAEERVVKPDISANVANLSSEQMENLPVASVEEVIGMQAGVRGMSIRGGDSRSMSFQVDGSSSYDGRAQQPFTGVSFTSINQIQVQSGGFNAEYGNLRSGLVNVVTKDAPRNRYTVDILARYSAPNRAYFGDVTPGSQEAYWMRPYLDPEVAMEGTGNWDRYRQRQYRGWDGWNDYADSNPQLSAEQWQEVFEWYHRKDFSINDPDYTIDGSLGGPVPAISDALGDLRFFASYRQTQDAYLVPQRRDSHRDRLGRLKLTSDVAPGLRVELQGMVQREYGLNSENDGGPSMFQGKGGWPNIAGDGSHRTAPGWEYELYGDDGWSLMDIEREMAGLELTHTLNSSTFYQVQGNVSQTYYNTHRSQLRDTSVVANTIGGLELTEGPLGGRGPFGLIETTPTGMALGRTYQGGIDSSVANRYTGSFDLTSQMTQVSQLKTGLDFEYSQHIRDTRRDYETVSFIIEDWNRSAMMGAAYAQNKLEFEGLIANVGVRLDYFSPVGEWFQYSPFDSLLGVAGNREQLKDMMAQTSTENALALSPRLGISFPITTNSKLFLNYGHFREMMDPINMYNIRNTTKGGVLNITRMGNPNHPLPTTVSYELGYEQNLFQQFLLRLTGYYKDMSKQPRSVSFLGSGGNVDYATSLPYNYEDIRGFEVSLNRNAGNIRGFVNYTFMAREGGNFGYGQYFENLVDAIDYARDYRNTVYDAVPQPYANANIGFLAPNDWGPELASGFHPLGDWRLNLLGSWRAGRTETWCGGGGSCPPELQNNVRWNDNWMLDLRLSKNFNTQFGQAQFFMDVSNVLNIRELNNNSFINFQEDRREYMRSLHLPSDAFEALERDPYAYIPGDDSPGDFRKHGTEFVPIEIVSSLEDNVQNPSERALYYEAPEDPADGTYFEWDGSSWQEADQGYVDQVLEDKSYIDMPNLRSFWFLNPREITFGFRYTF